MFETIMTPVNLQQESEIEKSLQCAADLAKQYNAQVVYVGVTGTAPSDFASNPDEYAQKLDAFTNQQISKYGISAMNKVQLCNDLTTDLDDALLKAIDETRADLVVMQTHLPSLSDYVWPSNGSKIARHSKISVMLVRK